MVALKTRLRFSYFYTPIFVFKSLTGNLFCRPNLHKSAIFCLRYCTSIRAPARGLLHEISARHIFYFLFAAHFLSLVFIYFRFFFFRLFLSVPNPISMLIAPRDGYGGLSGLPFTAAPKCNWSYLPSRHR